jgi:hypothetical protein
VAAVTDFANEAAALSAGFKKLQIDRGAGASYDRFQTILEKPMTGAGTSGGRMEARGVSSASAAAADTHALTVLNAQRRAHYGGSPGRASGDGDSPHSNGTVHTLDVT